MEDNTKDIKNMPEQSDASAAEVAEPVEPAKEEVKEPEAEPAKEEVREPEAEPAKDEVKEPVEEPAKEEATPPAKSEETEKMNKAKLTRIKWEITCFICLILFAVIDFFTIKYINAHTRQVVHGEEYRDVENHEFPDCLETYDDCVEQYFKVERKGLSRIGLRLAYNHGEYLERYGASCTVQVTEADTGKIVFFEEISEQEVLNWHYYWVFLEDMKKGEEYKLTIKQTEGLKDGKDRFILSWVPFIYSHEQKESDSKGLYPIENIRCEYNGEVQPYEFDLVYVYDYVDEWQSLYLIIANIVCALAFVGIYFLARTEKRKLSLIWTWLLPIPVLVIIETITGSVFTVLPEYWVVNLVCFYSVYICFMLFLRRMKAVIVVPIFAIALSIMQHFVSIFRGRPFMLQDLLSAKTAAQVAKSYTYDFTTPMGIALLIAVTLMGGLILLPPLVSKKRMIVRRIVAAICFFELCMFFSSPDQVKKSGLFSLNWWNIESSYANGGYLRTLLAQVSYLKEQKPENYSNQKVQEIVNQGVSEYEITTKEEDLKAPVNLIVIMNESWADFRYINSFNGDDEIMPYIDSLSRNVIKGYMYMPVFGAGTANSEWEVLTGNSMTNVNASSVPYQSYIDRKSYGMASKMKQLGYETLAMHPHEATNWNREKVYEWMGFDDFHSIEDWDQNNLERIRWCISDTAAYKELIHMYEQKTSDKWFTFLVTMQNHGGYDLEYDSSVNLTMKGNYPQAEQYLSLIKETDAAYKELIKYFSKVKEPTIIVMFGDHLPNVEQEFYAELFGVSDWDSIDDTAKRAIYATPYIVWANYPLEIDEMTGDERMTDYGVNGPELSSNYFGSFIMKWAGLPLAPYDEYLLNNYRKIPVYAPSMMRDALGKWTSYGKLEQDQEKLKNEYNIVQFNNMFDKKQRIDSLFSESE